MTYDDYHRISAELDTVEKDEGKLSCQSEINRVIIKTLKYLALIIYWMCVRDDDDKFLAENRHYQKQMLEEYMEGKRK